MERDSPLSVDSASSESKVHTSGWVSRFSSIRDKTDSLPAHPTGAPPTGGLGPGPDMEAARDLTALACGGAESPAPPGLERTLREGRHIDMRLYISPSRPVLTGVGEQGWSGRGPLGG